MRLAARDSELHRSLLLAGDFAPIHAKKHQLPRIWCNLRSRASASVSPRLLVHQSPPIRNLSWRSRAHGSHWHALRREAAGVRRVSDRGSARPGRQRGGHQGPHRKARVGVCKTRLQRRGRQKGQGGPDRPRLRSENRPRRKGAPLFRRASRWQHRRQSQRRHVRRRGAGRARGLFLDRRLNAVSRPDNDPDARGRGGHRGT